jgi:hypothetical protein
MENDILLYTTSFIAVRALIVLGFGYAVFRALRPECAKTARSHGRSSSIQGTNFVPDDRC